MDVESNCKCGMYSFEEEEEDRLQTYLLMLIIAGILPAKNDSERLHMHIIGGQMGSCLYTVGI